MVIGVDASRLVEPRTGVGRQFEGMLDAWARLDSPGFERVRLFAHAPIDDLPADDRFALEVLPSPTAGIGWQARQLRPRAAEVDVLLSPYSVPPRLPTRSVVSNLGIYEGQHGIGGWRARARSLHFAYSAWRADAVIANSESTKADLWSHYRVRRRKVRVIWPGFDPPGDGAGAPDAAAVEAAVVRVLGEVAPYFIFVGKLSARRNAPALVQAFAGVVADHPEARLLIVGADTTEAPIAAAIERFDMTGAVRHVTEHLDHETLSLLYRGATAFVLPTEHEGFSDTIPRALASGCAVLTVDHAALGEAGLRVGVHALRDARPGTLAPALARLLNDDDFRRELEQRASACAHTLPTTDEHARAVLDVVRGVAAGGRLRSD